MTDPRDRSVTFAVGRPTPYVKRCPQCKLLHFDGGHDPETCDGKGVWPGAAFSREVLETSAKPTGIAWEQNSRDDRMIWEVGAAPRPMTPHEAAMYRPDPPVLRCARCSHKPRAPGELDCVDCMRAAVLE